MVLRRVPIVPAATLSIEEHVAHRSNLLRQDFELVKNAFVAAFNSISGSGQVIKEWDQEMIELFTRESWRNNLVDEGKWTVLTTYIQLLYCLITKHYRSFDELTKTKEVQVEGTIHRIYEIRPEFSAEWIKSAIERDSRHLRMVNMKISALVDLMKEQRVPQLVPAYLEELFEFMSGSPPAFPAFPVSTTQHSISVYSPRSRRKYWT